VVDTFCAACGFDLTQHPAPQGLREGPNSWSTCAFSPVSRFPLLDVGHYASAQSQEHPNGTVHHLPAQKGTLHWTIREVLAATDPALTLAVRSIIVPLNLSCFPTSHRTSISGEGVLRPTASNVADLPRLDFAPISEPEYISLASSAVLAIAVREFAHHLLHQAITAFASDHALEKGRAALAPAHVCRSAVGSFLARDSIFSDLPSSPVALALSTVVKRQPRNLPPPSAVMETP
jgi:hypothetical protein